MSWLLATILYWGVIVALVKLAIGSMNVVWAVPLGIWAFLLGPAICISIGAS